MSDLSYFDPRLVSLYDTLNGWSDDNQFYFHLPKKVPSKILDVGCGTGTLAVKLAESGHNVVGLDPAAEMITAAKRKTGGSNIDWCVGTLSDYQSNELFDLVVMTGHAFQCLLTDKEISEAFTTIHALLSDEGRFVFETRNPNAKAWQHWVPEHSEVNSMTPGGLKFRMYHQLKDVYGELIAFDTYYFVGESDTPMISTSTLRFATFEKIEFLAKQANLSVVEAYGDWDKTELNDRSAEIILTLKRA